MPIAVISGMASEARLLQGMGLLAVATGGYPEATRRHIDILLQEGADRLISFGIAGALDPALRPGDLVLGSAVRTPDGQRIPVDQRWLVHIAGHLPKARIADVVGSSGIVARAEQKAMLHRDTGAASVDQESHWVAEAALAAGIPFLVLRAVADRAGDNLPPAVLVGLDVDGRPRGGAVAAALLRDPLQLGGLIRVAFQTRKALKALFRGRAALLV
jgi:hopanoid-associated phosphorylase